MNESELIAQTVSSYELNVIDAIKNPNATTRVLESAINNAKSERILIEVLNSHLLNEYLYQKTFSKAKEISNNITKELTLLIISKPYCSFEIFDYYIENLYNVEIAKALIRTRFINENFLVKILKSSITITEDLYAEIINSTTFSPLVLKEIINLKPINDKVISMCLDNVFLTDEEVFKDITKICFENYGTLTVSCEKLLSHRMLTKEMLLEILNEYSETISAINEFALNNRFCDREVLKAIKITNTETLEKVLNHPSLDSDVLVALLDKHKNMERIKMIISCPKTNEDVIIKVISILKEKTSTDYKPVIEQILTLPFITERTLIEIVEKFENASFDKLIEEHPKAEKGVKIALLSNSDFFSTSSIDTLFNIPNLTEDDVIKVIMGHSKSKELLERAVEFPNATNKLYSIILSSIYTNKIKSNVKDEDEIERMIQEVLSGNKMTDYKKIVEKLLEKDIDEKLLVGIIKNEKDIEIIKKAMDHPNASINVVAVINVLCDGFDKQTQEMLIEKAKELKHRIMSQIYNIETEENVTEMLRMNVEDGLSTMLWGASGVGKSSRVFEIDPTATMLILKNGMLPEEVIGGKEPNGEPGEIYPPHWYVVLCEKCKKEPDRKHILFIDEFTNVSDTIKNLVWEVVGNRLVNGHEEWPLPENCSIVVAGNRPEESSAVRIDATGGVMPAPLHNRIDSMIEIKFDIDEWQKWALETDTKTGKLKIHPIVYSFCIANADKVMFTQYNPEDVTTPFLSPRKWETLSKAIYKAEERGENCHISDMRIYSILGKTEIAQAFISHYERLPLDMNKIINGEYTEEDFPTIDDKLYALGTAIAKYEGDDIAIEDFIITCLGDEYLSIYKNLKNMRNEVLSTIGQEMKNINK